VIYHIAKFCFFFSIILSGFFAERLSLLIRPGPGVKRLLSETEFCKKGIA